MRSLYYGNWSRCHRTSWRNNIGDRTRYGTSTLRCDKEGKYFSRLAFGLQGNRSFSGRFHNQGHCRILPKESGSLAYAGSNCSWVVTAKQIILKAGPSCDMKAGVRVRVRPSTEVKPITIATCRKNQWKFESGTKIRTRRRIEILYSINHFAFSISSCHFPR